MISTPVLAGDSIYGVDSYGELRCLDAATGDRVWEDQTATRPDRWSNIHIVRNGDHYWMFNEVGQLIISKLARRFRGDQPSATDRSHAGTVAPPRRSLLVASGVRVSARVRPQRQGTRLRQPGETLTGQERRFGWSTFHL